MPDEPSPGTQTCPDRARVAVAPRHVARPHWPSCQLARRRLSLSPEPVFDPFSPPTCVLSRWNIVGRKEVPAGLGSRPGSTTGFTEWAFAFHPPLSFFRAAPSSAQKKGRGDRCGSIGCTSALTI